jgi:hypothetical protein
MDILIGAGLYGKPLTGRREILQYGLVAIETYLGWTVAGKIQSCIKTRSETTLSMFVHSEDKSNL